MYSPLSNKVLLPAPLPSKLLFLNAKLLKYDIELPPSSKYVLSIDKVFYNIKYGLNILGFTLLDTSFKLYSDI